MCNCISFAHLFNYDYGFGIFTQYVMLLSKGRRRKELWADFKKCQVKIILL